MCLIAMAWGVSPQYPLVIAANRDEFYARPTAPLARWTTQAGHTIVSGRDLRDGGTWMGFADNGRFAMLTNVRNPAATPPAQPRSRGALVVDWLTSPLSAHTWSHQLALHHYAGFNLIIGDWVRQHCHYLSNQHTSPAAALLQPNTAPAQHSIAQAATENIALTAIQPGQTIGLSNAALNTPWPKTLQLVNDLGQALKAPTPLPDLPDLHTHLQTALRSDSPFQDQHLPRTGVPLAQERALSSVFVRYPPQAPAYGTRTSLTAILSPQHRLHLHETTHDGGLQVPMEMAWPGF
jgi:uncharacterized protein with NRDE domain